uniref:Uncharacterized protein n=1 Tax=Anopheles merus TaxID=30066 RepID=A0A182UZI8_ANOME
MTTFLATSHTPSVPFVQATISSISGGNMRASEEEQKAPMSEMKAPSTIMMRNTISQRTGWRRASGSRLSTIGHMIMMATKNCSAYPSSTPVAIISFTLSATPVAGEAERGEQQDDEGAADVEHAERFAKVGRMLHLVLQRQHQRDALEREDRGTVEQGQLLEPADQVPFADRWQLLERVVERDADAERHEDVGGERAVGQELQLGDDGRQHDRHDQQRHVQVHVQHEPVPVRDLLEVGADEHEVDAAEAELRHADEDVDRALHRGGPRPHRRRPVREAERDRVGKVERFRDGRDRVGQLLLARCRWLAVGGARPLGRLLLELAGLHQRGTVEQHVLAVHAHEPDEQGQHGRQQQAPVLERVAHRVAARADVALEQVHHRLRVARLVVRLDALRRNDVLGVIVPGPLAMMMVPGVVPHVTTRRHVLELERPATVRTVERWLLPTVRCLRVPVGELVRLHRPIDTRRSVTILHGDCHRHLAQLRLQAKSSKQTKR